MSNIVNCKVLGPWIYRIHQQLIDECKPVNPQTVINAYQGRTEQPKMLREVFRLENAK